MRAASALRQRAAVTYRLSNQGTPYTIAGILAA